MPDFDKLSNHVNNLQALLATRKTDEGFGVWGLMVGQEWKAIAEMWRKPEVEHCPDCGEKIIPYCPACDHE